MHARKRHRGAGRRLPLLIVRILEEWQQILNLIGRIGLRLVRGGGMSLGSIAPFCVTASCCISRARAW